jgi:hypothetical protein
MPQLADQAGRAYIRPLWNTKCAFCVRSYRLEVKRALTGADTRVSLIFHKKPSCRRNCGWHMVCGSGRRGDVFVRYGSFGGNA